MYREIADLTGVAEKSVIAVEALLNEGATVPFIARYRKEKTGSLDEVEIRNVRDALERIQEREKRRDYILQQITSQEKLTPELEKAIKKVMTLQELEDLYLPYKPKRKTRATKAKDAGLEALAEAMYAQKNASYMDTLKNFHCEEYADDEAVLQGARDIIAEKIAETAETRKSLRDLFLSKATLATKKAPKTAKAKKAGVDREKLEAKYKDYLDFSEPIEKMPSHRILAVLRAENEGVIKFNIQPEAETAVRTIKRDHLVKGDKNVVLAIEDSYKRLIQPSLETECINELKERAYSDAIAVFADNLQALLLEAPMGEVPVLALDPGFRTGCKLVALDGRGNVLDHGVIYPVEPFNKTAEAASIVKKLVDMHGLKAVAIGNGTAGRETEAFIRGLGLKGIKVIMVNESGASVYSASEVARREFPDFDLTLRGAISIGRRLMDPLAELVKIDAKSIGVGQYQHDVDQKMLRSSLDDVVLDCVNKVGVELNSASLELLSYVSGINTTIAKNILDYRKQNGSFASRAELKKVKGLGPKAYEQAAGFLRIRDAKNPLDSSAVHPESYKLVKDIADAYNLTLKKLVGNKAAVDKIELKKFVNDAVGLPTLKDIQAELVKPGRDPRAQFQNIEFADGVNDIKDLTEGIVLNGIVTNVTQFGAFVDIGVHQDGLVHVSEIADRFIQDPREELSPRQHVKVKVVSVEVDRKRIGLSIKQV